MNRAVIYARYSCEKQTEQSIEGQLRVCEEYAKANGYNIVDTYIDRAISGKTDKRPNFMKLIEDSSNKHFDYVIVYKLDRFSRSRYDSAIYKALLKRNKVKVLSACEQITDSPEGIILEALIEGMAEYYSADLSQKTKRGMKETIIKGNYTGGVVLYGYKVVNQKYVIDEKNAEAVRYIFEEYALGTPKVRIIEELNKRGYLYNGRPFKVNDLQNKLNNTRYIGINEYEGEVYTNTYPQIIDNKTFERVQEMLKRNKNKGGANRAKANYLLSGKVFCGLCGNTMIGTSGKSRTKEKHHYYTCSARYKYHSCKKGYERKYWLEDFVFDKTLKYVLKQNIIESIVNNAYVYFKENNESEYIKEIKEKIQNIDNELKMNFSVFQKTNSKEMIRLANLEIEKLEKDKEPLVKQLQVLELAEKTFSTKSELRALFNMFLKEKDNDEKYRERIIKLFINSRFVFEGKVVIYYNLFDNTPTSFEDMQKDMQNNFKRKGIEHFSKVDISMSYGEPN